MKVETVEVYVAYDGTRFYDENECRAYEAKLDRYNNAVEKLPAELSDIGLFCSMTLSKNACGTCPIADLCYVRPPFFASLEAYLDHIKQSDAWNNVYHNRIADVQND